ncbi:Magnesium transporter protein 1 [Fulvia fulva]|uniref:Magnesium transporter protein 1 n=1 Tax=Passalora fulva TaxID=5499 RepID=A0A9Q8PGD4_PASFU|nr:Magnesium transporter protein 1 [Fulvia fulva]KAK4613323.1 Magnesium transporter protein 1 [Fulvia fulva]KAK4615035.1 Magnesium transporter protein 1 [Fulvia fulva]UJO21993.1 Magnesium transporter protein 1 [Fulvia fulva]WPV20214.1 Magnesium transporter protein 1 [Fulvia fulva]WPV35649.1 Magnesium transporter protein 1 [Fulvia fulva]
MRVRQLIATALLPLTALAAKKTPAERFDAAVAKAQPINLDDKSYDALTKAPRDYSAAILLTAMDARFGCQLCNEFQPEWELLGKSWTKGDKNKESRLVFGTLDFMDGKGTFQSLQLQTAPVLLLFHPTTGPHARPNKPLERLDFNTGINKADTVHHWLSRQLPDRPHPALVRPINYVKIAVTVTAVLGAGTFLTVAAPYLLPIIQNRNLWAAISLIAVLLFTSGHMFNHIRKVPYVQADGKGGVSYFAGGFQSQFGLETQIVAAMYGVLSFATISLALKVPRMTDPRAQQIAVFVWGGVILGMYSFLLSVFRIKNGGYPFWLPPF